MDRQNIYLSTVSPTEAVRRAIAELDREKLILSETIPSAEAYGRVTARGVHARCSSPTFHSAAMDGVAVKAASTFQAREERPVRLALGRDFRYVNTGAALPADMDAVIMIEDIVREGEDAILVEAPVHPWSHVRRIGEDIVATELILPCNRTITAYDVGALLTAGIFEIAVLERVRAVFIPTGDEVLPFQERPSPKPGQVIESNSQVFKALCTQWGVDATTLPPVGDDPEKLAAAARQALKEGAHLVVLGAGSSAGSRDFTREVFESMGRILAHGLSIMPGKPGLLAVSDENSPAPGRLLAGAPGYPVSTVVFCEEVLAPIFHWLGRGRKPAREKVQARLARRTPSRMGVEEMVRLCLGRVKDRYVATPLARGAGMITSLTKAQGFTRIPPECEGLEAGEDVEAELFVPEAELRDVLVHVGSHDNTLDILADALMSLEEPLRLVSSHVGSMAGLTALKQNAALFAGCHLFDPQSGDFNFSFLSKYLPEHDVLLLNLAIRHQGLMVVPGNPKSIRDVQDLARDDVVFANRQRGSGTRILLDHHLQMAGILPEQVRGYEREEYTHMGVAVNVLTGVSDCGLGIMAAAQALDLDFQPLARERYDLAIPAEHRDDRRIETLVSLIRSRDFQTRIRELGGYETTLTGRWMSPDQGLG